MAPSKHKHQSLLTQYIQASAVYHCDCGWLTPPSIPRLSHCWYGKVSKHKICFAVTASTFYTTEKL